MKQGRKKGRKKRGRANGHGTLERGASGVYLARWMANGKRHSRSTGTHNLRDAEKKLEEFTATFRLESEQRTLETLTGRIEGVKAEIRKWKERRPALRLVDAFDAYRASTARPDAGKRTLSDYESCFNRFLSWMKENRPEETTEGEKKDQDEGPKEYAVEVRAVTAADAEAYAAHVIDHFSAGTFNKHLVFLRCLWRVLMDGDEGKSDDADKPERLKAKILENPWLRIRKRKHTPHARRELTVEELGAVIGAAAGEMRLLLALGIYTGLRLGDCALLEWGSVDLVRRLVSVVPRKTARRTGKRVTVPLHDVLAGMLLEIPERRRRGYVLPETAKDYKCRGPTFVTDRIKSLFEKCGIKTSHVDDRTGRAAVDVGFHSLRHTFVSLSANGGAPMAAVQSIVGHGSPAMTRHYYHESESALRRVVAALPDVANGEKADKQAKADRLADFRAMVDAMTPGDLAKAARYLAKVRRSKARGK